MVPFQGYRLRVLEGSPTAFTSFSRLNDFQVTLFLW